MEHLKYSVIMVHMNIIILLLLFNREIKRWPHLTTNTCRYGLDAACKMKALYKDMILQDVNIHYTYSFSIDIKYYEFLLISSKIQLPDLNQW